MATESEPECAAKTGCVYECSKALDDILMELLKLDKYPALIKWKSAYFTQHGMEYFDSPTYKEAKLMIESKDKAKRAKLDPSDKSDASTEGSPSDESEDEDDDTATTEEKPKSTESEEEEDDDSETDEEGEDSDETDAEPPKKKDKVVKILDDLKNSQDSQ
jgi:hypothetical protein